MNKEEKINTLRRLIKSNPICDFGRKKLQTAKLHKIHNDLLFFAIFVIFIVYKSYIIYA